ncbi:MAG: hypothetical protein CSA94_01685 [Bacteroidetes bacterium]|nr:MAG: hypothetical protein CSA94_01685 [Bacteroidota bacterium]
MEQLPHKSKLFTAEITGIFPEYSFPTNEHLVLKKEAQVMFVKNDSSPEKLYYNGKIGVITGFEKGAVKVRCEGDYADIEVYPEEWQNVKYSINNKTKAIEEEVVGQFKQYPLKLAWAITIHKSQGLTFERAIIDAESAFAHGQVYVALSRCKTLEGLVLKTELNKSGIICDNAVAGFVNYMGQHQPDEKELHQAQRNFEYQLLSELFDFSEIIRLVSRCDRLLQDNQSIIQGNLPDRMAKAINLAIPQIKQVAEKFLPHIHQYCFSENGITENNEAQERIGKACKYFIDKINDNLITVWHDYSFETDNQAIAKQVIKYMEELYEKIDIKITCLNASVEKFDSNTYMEARAKAMLKKVSFFTKAKAEVTVEHPVLMRRLRSWRNATADLGNVPIYYIASQQSLVEICNKLPYTAEQLKGIKGFGKKKIERYGEELIEIVMEYRQEKGLGLLNFSSEEEEQTNEQPKKAPQKKKPKTDTRKITLDLFKEGKSAEEIAEIRNYAVATIEGHFTHLVKQGDIVISELLEEEKIEKISEVLQKLDKDVSLTEAKSQLGETVSYAELRHVKASLLAKNNK